MKSSYHHLDFQRIAHKLWQRELDLIAEDNDFLLSLLESLQTEQIVTHRYDQKTTLFFNHFQYFFNQTKQLKNGLDRIERQNLAVKSKSNDTYLKQEIECLIQRFCIFKDNFKAFLSKVSVANSQYSYY